MCIQAAKAATIEKHYSSQNNRLAAALADMHDALGQVKQDAAATADHFKNFQVGSDVVQPHAQSLSRELLLATLSQCDNV